MKKNKRFIQGVLAVTLFALLASCSSLSNWVTGIAPAHSASNTPSRHNPQPAADNTGAAGQRTTVLAEGEKYIDAPYQSPPNAPSNFDCSGFISYLYGEHADIDLPTASGAYINVGELIDMKDAQPGDILIFTSEPGGKKINHVAILHKKSESGELRGSTLLHAISIPTKSATLKGNPDTTGVKISELGKRGDGKWQQEYFLSRFHSVRRVIVE